MARLSISAAFLSFDEPIGRIVGTEVYPTESFLRLMESLFLRTGGEADQIKEVTEETEQFIEVAGTLSEGQAALDEAVALAQQAAETADSKAAEAKADAALAKTDAQAANTALDGAVLVGTKLGDFETRITNLETP